MSFNDLRQLRKAAGITQDALAARLGVNRATISKYENGQIEPTLSQLQAIADALGVHLLDLIGLGAEFDKYEAKVYSPADASTERTTVNIREVYDSLSSEAKNEFWEAIQCDHIKNTPSDLSEEAKKIANDYEKLTDHGKGAVKAILSYEGKAASSYTQQDQGSAVLTFPKAKKSRGMIEINVYDQPAAAGLGNYLDEPPFHVEQYPADVIPPKADFGIIISGDSMEPKVHDGGTVFVQAAPTIDAGKIGIFVLNGKSYCKKLAVDRENRQIRLVSLNDKYEDIVVGEFDQFYTMGRVLGQWTPGRKQDFLGW